MPLPFSEHDVRFMQRALALAGQGLGAVEPNPLVGAVVARGDRVVGEGYHQRFGTAHAEVHAILAAGDRAKGATLYVTLEPCCHWGKTPPCTDAILAAGISRVVVAMIDPYAEVHGKGARLLRRAGVKVEVGLLQASAAKLNAPFITRLSLGRPYVIAKWAQSLDGCVALYNGESQWISSETSRAFVQTLRGRMDAIIIGLGTAIADDPLLMARPAKGGQIRRIATRVVFDSECRLPPEGQLARTVPFAPVMVVHMSPLGRAAERRRKVLADKGVMTVGMPADKEGRPRIGALLKHLAKRDYTNVLVEGGPELMATFLRQGLVDEAHVFIAPMVIGGTQSRHAVAGGNLSRLKDAPRMEFVEATRSGVDVHLVGRMTQSDGGSRRRSYKK